jgi:hypothetical protein
MLRGVTGAMQPRHGFRPEKPDPFLDKQVLQAARSAAPALAAI